MAQNSDNAPDERKGEQDEILRELDRIDERLLGQLNDPRLENGIPPSQRRDDLSFIQMSGMTSSADDETPKVLPPLGDSVDLDTTKPLSFFEKGVRDVDAEMAPGGTLDKENIEAALPPSSSSAAAMPPIRDIIADLSEKARAAGAGEKDSAGEAAPSGETIAPPPSEAPLSHTETPDLDAAFRETVLPPSDLKAAERLLHEMESEPPLPNSAEFAPEEADVPEESRGAGNDPEEEKPPRRRGKRRSRARNQFGVLIARLTVTAITLGMLGFLGYEGYQLYKARWAGPETLYDQASLYAANGEYRRASDAYLQFVARQPNSPLRPEAQFGAAFALQESRPESRDEAQRVYEKSLTLFQQFINDNPTHPKAARAQILMGILSFELGKYQQAIEMLQDPELRLKDPVAAVPMLRTLGRSYAKLGDEESARSYYLQSAGMAGNHTPDVDFEELGMLYHSLAERATKPEAKARYVQQALQHWASAAQIPGIDPASKANIRNKVEVLKGKASDGATSSPAAGPVEGLTPDASIPADSPEAAPDVESVEVPADEAAMAPALDGEATPAPDAAPAPGDSVEPQTDAAAEAAPAPETSSTPEQAATSETAPDPAAAPAENASEGASTDLPKTESEAPSAHTVKTGDTLGKLATKYHVTVPELRSWNGLRDDVIRVGERLQVKRPADDAKADYLPLPEAPVVADPAEIQTPQPEAKGEPQ